VNRHYVRSLWFALISEFHGDEFLRIL